MKKTVLLGATVLGLSLSAATSADDMASAAQDLCEHVKGCALAQMQSDPITPELRQMMEPMLASVCVGLQARFQGFPEGHELSGPATACMRSMQSMSCEEISEMDDNVSQACKDYEEQAKKYDIQR